jgi:hypothetical protein
LTESKCIFIEPKVPKPTSIVDATVAASDNIVKFLTCCGFHLLSNGKNAIVSCELYCLLPDQPSQCIAGARLDEMNL